jgi:hypothetical protein
VGRGGSKPEAFRFVLGDHSQVQVP